MEKKRYSHWPLEPAINAETHVAGIEPAQVPTSIREPHKVPAPVIYLPAETDRPTRLMALDELAEFLGVSTRWIYDNHENLGIPALRIGRVLRFRPAEINAWLDTRSTTRTDRNAAPEPSRT